MNLIDFTNRGSSVPFARDGWSLPETHGTWAVGQCSKITFHAVPPTSDIELDVTLLAHTNSPARPEQPLQVSCNGSFVFEGTLGGGWSNLKCRIPQDLLLAGGENTLIFQHPGAFSPSTFGISSDVRPLAFLVRSIAFVGGDIAAPPGTGALSAEGTAQPHPVIHVVRQGRQGNQFIQWFAASKLRSLVPGALISNVSLPEWNVVRPAVGGSGPTDYQADPQFLEMEACASRLRSGEIKRVEISGFAQRIEYFLPVDTYRRLIGPPNAAARVSNDDELLINIRAAEIFNAISPSYTILPIDFYDKIVRDTGLRPVFLGQIEDNIYTSALRARFPEAEFIPSRGAYLDFESVRAARNIVPAVSTFSWVAAWLSCAKEIFFPVTGFFNPTHEPRIDLLPLDDERYKFYLFPFNHAVQPSELLELHRAITPFIRAVTPEMLRMLVKEKPRFPRRLEDYERYFCEAAYVDRFPEVSVAVKSGAYSSPLEHFRRVGFQRNFQAFDMDDTWYVREYPLAAFEVGQGDFVDLAHHFVTVGALRGYRRTRPPAP